MEMVTNKPRWSKSEEEIQLERPHGKIFGGLDSGPLEIFPVKFEMMTNKATLNPRPTFEEREFSDVSWQNEQVTVLVQVQNNPWSNSDVPCPNLRRKCQLWCELFHQKLSLHNELRYDVSCQNCPDLRLGSHLEHFLQENVSLTINSNYRLDLRRVLQLLRPKSTEKMQQEYVGKLEIAKSIHPMQRCTANQIIWEITIRKNSPWQNVLFQVQDNPWPNIGFSSDVSCPDLRQKCQLWCELFHGKCLPHLLQENKPKSDTTLGARKCLEKDVLNGLKKKNGKYSVASHISQYSKCRRGSPSLFSTNPCHTSVREVSVMLPNNPWFSWRQNKSKSREISRIKANMYASLFNNFRFLITPCQICSYKYNYFVRKCRLLLDIGQMRVRLLGRKYLQRIHPDHIDDPWQNEQNLLFASKVLELIGEKYSATNGSCQILNYPGSPQDQQCLNSSVMIKEVLMDRKKSKTTKERVDKTLDSTVIIRVSFKNRLEFRRIFLTLLKNIMSKRNVSKFKCVVSVLYCKIYHDWHVSVFYNILIIHLLSSVMIPNILWENVFELKHVREINPEENPMNRKKSKPRRKMWIILPNKYDRETRQITYYKWTKRPSNTLESQMRNLRKSADKWFFHTEFVTQIIRGCFVTVGTNKRPSIRIMLNQ